MAERYDFSGWATRNDIRCSDGRTIRRNAFKDQNGTIVPLVWMHQHNTPDNVLGHAVLENRKEGVYAYCTFNDTESGRIGKQLVAHKDIVGLSIYANQLKQSPAKDVVHGMIREVSLVIAGANPGAKIDAVLAHGEDSDEAMVMELVLEHSDLGLDFEEGEVEIYHADNNREDDDEDMKDMTVQEVFDTLTDDQKDLVYSIVGQVVSSLQDDDPDNDISGEEVEEMLDGFDDDQKTVVYALIGQAIQDAENGEMEHADDDSDGYYYDDEDEYEDDDEEYYDDDEEYDEDEDDDEYYDDEDEYEDDEEYDEDDEEYEDDEEFEHSDFDDDDEYYDDDDDPTLEEVFDTLTDEQKDAVYAIVGNAVNDNFEGDEDMKHNIFDNDGFYSDEVLTHSDMEEILDSAKRNGSLKEAYEDFMAENFLQHDDDATPETGPGISWGITNIDNLFPDAQRVADPFILKRNDDWVSILMNGAKHTPFSRVKSLYADITEDAARAKGYIKGTLKKDEVFPLFKRVTNPTTVYKKQKLDRDDLLDIDFDVIPWIKSEMRVLLNEEIARAALVGDGRGSADEDKINPLNIRPIYLDTEQQVYAFNVPVTPGADDDATAKAFIRACIKGRKDYRGTGKPILFVTTEMLTNMLLLEDGIGRALYETEDALATKLRVSKIVEVPVMDNHVRENVSGYDYALAGIVVNPADYCFGADKGGAVSLFDDFDIDYNAMKYLIETRCSGALIVPKSAMILELKTAHGANGASGATGESGTT